MQSLFSHLGRVKEEADKEGKSLAPVAADLAAKLGQDVKFIPGVTRGAELEAAVNALEDGQVLLVENTRFEDVDGKKESKMILNLVNTGHHLEMVSS